jgi:hypothetical protein
MSLCYEDLVRQPRESLLHIGEFTGEDLSNINLLSSQQSVWLDTNHALAGNPIRFQQGAIKIRPDTEWREKMAPSQKYIVTALTWPLLGGYGYLGSNRVGGKGG